MRGARDRTLLVMQCETGRCKSQDACTTIRAVYLALDETLLLEFIDKLTGACPVQCHPLRKGVLINPGCIVQMNQDGKLQWGKSRRLMHLRYYSDGDLVKTTAKSDGCLRSEFAIC